MSWVTELLLPKPTLNTGNLLLMPEDFRGIPSNPIFGVAHVAPRRHGRFSILYPFDPLSPASCRLSRRFGGALIPLQSIDLLLPAGDLRVGAMLRRSGRQ